MPKTLITEEIYNYALNMSSPIDEQILNLRQYTNETLPENASMLSSLDQLQLMMTLVRVMNVTKYLEIGVFTGSSTLAVAKAMLEDGIIYALEHNEDYLNIAKQYWQQANVINKIKPFCGDALVILQNLIKHEKNVFDMIFIDANKSAYLDYYHYSYQLLRQGGIILIDNTFLAGRILNNSNPPNYVKTVQQLNTKLSNDQTVKVSVLPIADGLTIVYKL